MPQPQINSDLLNFIRANCYAVATNCGFYYQYLNVVLKWLTNFVEDNDIDTYTEVDDDISLKPVSNTHKESHKTINKNDEFQRKLFSDY